MIRIILFLTFMLHSVCCASAGFLVIAHRGASGYRPEHTLAAYQLAINQGADFIEPDLVVTKDGVLIARHENEISGTTDVAEKFPRRKTTKIVDGERMEGWFAEDFTLAEIKTLRAKERLPFRDHSFDFKFSIPTFEEVVELARKNGVGVYPETKHPTYFRAMGLALEPRLIQVLKSYRLTTRTSPVIVQSFEFSSLREVGQAIDVRLVFLVDDFGKRPFDHVVAGDARTYGDLMRPTALQEMARVIYGLGPWKQQIIPESAEGVLQAPTNLIKEAHAAGLKVYAYTFRAEKQFLNPAYEGDLTREVRDFKDLGVDGVFSDFPDLAVKARER